MNGPDTDAQWLPLPLPPRDYRSEKAPDDAEPDSDDSDDDDERPGTVVVNLV